MSIIKDEAKKIIEKLPEQATWDDIIYHLYVRKKISNSLEAAERQEIVDHEEVKKRVLKQ